MSHSLVSVLLPVHNGAATLRRAVESILWQDYPHFELLLVNNASMDATHELIEQFVASDARVRGLYEARQGIAYALNRGLQEARGRYIARMDADDVSLPGRLGKQVRFLEANPQIGLVSGQVEFCGSNEAAQGYSEYVNHLNTWNTEAELYRYRFVESPLAHPSVMFRKACTDRFGTYTEQPEPEDYELWLRWFEQGIRMAKLPESVLQWHDSPGRLSRIHAHYSAAAFDRVRYRYLARWLRQRQSSGLPPLYVWGGGKLATRKMKLLEQLSGIPIAGIIDLKEKSGTALPHLHFSNLPQPGQAFVVSMVSNRGKYLEIEQFLEKRGYRFERDYLLAG